MDWILILGLTLCTLIAYSAGRADILRRVWKRVRRRERVKLTLKKIVPEAEPYPRFYGKAYYDWGKGYMFERVAYPVPLNLVIRYARTLRLWIEIRIRFPKPSWADAKIGEAYLKGRDIGANSYEAAKADAYLAGRKKGHEDGFEAGRTMLFGALRKELARESSIIRATLVNELHGKDDAIDDADTWAQVTEANDDNPPS